MRSVFLRSSVKDRLYRFTVRCYKIVDLQKFAASHGPSKIEAGSPKQNV